MAVTGRFAPSPSGRIHLGNILCCLLAWLSARQKGGRVILRIEDLDTARCPRRYGEQMCRDIQWLGLDWDEGPVIGAASAPHREDGQVVYPGTCRGLTAEQAAERARCTGRAPALRLRVPEEEITFIDGHMGEYGEWLPEDCGDFLLRRSDGMFAYQLAVVVDDAAMGVTEVVRGADLLASTPRQLLLYRLLGLEAPAFYHFPLLLGSDGQRLSKRNADAGLDTLGERYTASEILGKLAYLAGFNPSAEPRSGESLLADFAWEKVPRADIRIPEGLF